MSSLYFLGYLPYGGMMTEPNYEVLGRYHATREIFEQLRQQRNKALSELKAAVGYGASPVSGGVIEFNADAVEAALAEARTVDAEFVKCVAALNEFAAIVGKPTVKIERR
ncbi:hypothetical protein [Burkholderia contaminans]|uniref:hypothetical protein n=1 Tax=Burkholderia contaminans TaxID=488447 RepID=UPI001453CABA|nr:hypothetical protein [Burkholderia contaminans]VWD22880.1 hypothetical protein BCO18442_04056 [Burkholderia contaminans]